MVTITISLTEDEIKLLDSFVKRFNFSSRSEFFQTVLRMLEKNPDLASQVLSLRG